MEATIISILSQNCRNTQLAGLKFEKEYLELIDAITTSSLSDNDKITILAELYRYNIYSRPIMSMDTRGDTGFKYTVISALSKALEPNTNAAECVKKAKTANDIMRSDIDNFAHQIKKDLKFKQEHPGVKF